MTLVVRPSGPSPGQSHFRRPRRDSYLLTSSDARMPSFAWSPTVQISS
jgi:hypothetical protein